jgi:hypothetical protein
MSAARGARLGGGSVHDKMGTESIPASELILDTEMRAGVHAFLVHRTGSLARVATFAPSFVVSPLV